MNVSDCGVHKKGQVDFSRLLDSFKDSLDDSEGAIGSFIGMVRKDAKKEGKVKQLHFECAEEAENELRNIAANIEEEIEGISKVCIHHIIDDLEPGDEIIYVIVGGDHRKEVFEALPKIMNRVKSEVRIWKKEITDDEDYWIHE